MKHLNDIIFDNQEWEARAQKRAMSQQAIRDAQVPWQALRAMWGDGPSNMALLKWWEACDATTRKMIDPS